MIAFIWGLISRRWITTVLGGLATAGISVSFSIWLSFPFFPAYASTSGINRVITIFAGLWIYGNGLIRCDYFIAYFILAIYNVILASLGLMIRPKILQLIKKK